MAMMAGFLVTADKNPQMHATTHLFTKEAMPGRPRTLRLPETCGPMKSDEAYK